MKVIAIVVSYNGQGCLVDTVRALVPQVAEVIIVDNGSSIETIQIAQEICVAHQNVYLFQLNENFGVAAALNRGAAIARERGALWILTMDQDSIAASDMVESLIACAEASRSDVVAAVSEKTSARSNSRRVPCDWSPALVAITSGNLVRLETLESLGGYREDYFIDSVDFEFCLRLRKYGRRLVKCASARMQHQLGRSRRIEVAGLRTFTVIEHQPSRRYYMLRNHLYLVRQYFFSFPLFLTWKSAHIALTAARVIIFGPSRRENIACFFDAALDFLRGVRGNREHQRRNAPM